MKEEIIALVPVALLLTRSLGYPAVTAVAMSLGAAAVGAAFSPINPFQVGIAQQLAQIPLLSGSLFRIAFLALAVAAWIWCTMRHARRARAEPAARALGACHDGRPHRRPRARAEPQRSCGADVADSGPALGPARLVASGHGARLPVRGGAVRAPHADERRLDGDPRHGRRPL